VAGEFAALEAAKYIFGGDNVSKAQGIYKSMSNEGGGEGSQRVRSAPVGGSGTTTSGVGNPPVNAGIREILLDTNRVSRQNLQVSRQQVTKLGEAIDVLGDIKYGIENLARNEANSSLKGGRGGPRGSEAGGGGGGGEGGGLLKNLLEGLGLYVGGATAVGGAKSIANRLAKSGERKAAASAAKIGAEGVVKAETTVGKNAAAVAADARGLGSGAKPEVKEGALAAKESVEAAAKKGGKVAIKEAIAKVISPKIAKSVASKIPLVGLAAGVAFGAWRLFADGDWKGATAEVAGGAASTLPGAGTAASIGIDIGLLARDVYQAVYGVFPEDDPQSGERMSEVYSQVKEYVMSYISGSKPESKSPAAPPGQTPAIAQKKGREDRDQQTNKTTGLSDLRSEYQQSTKDQSSAEDSLKAFEEEQTKSGSKFTEQEDDYSYAKIKTYSDPETQKKYKELQAAEYEARSKKTDIYNKARIRGATGKDKLGKDNYGMDRSAASFGTELEDSIQMVEALINAGYTIDELQKLGGGANKDSSLKIGEYSFNPGAITALYNKVIEKTLNVPSNVQDPKKNRGGGREDRDQQSSASSLSKETAVNGVRPTLPTDAMAEESYDNPEDTDTTESSGDLNRLQSASGVAGVSDKLINADTLSFTSKEIKFSAEKITFEQTAATAATPGTAAGPSASGGGSVTPGDVAPYDAKQDRDRQGGTAPSVSTSPATGPSPATPGSAPSTSTPSGSAPAGATPAAPGGPTTPGGKKTPTKPNLTRIKTKSGKSVEVAGAYAKNFQGFIDELEATGYNIRRLGGYADRANVNNPKVKSYHASGAAIDINDDTNPNNSRKTDLPSNIGAIAAKYGLGWGMNFKKTPDPMHFSIAKEEYGSVNIPRNGQIEAGEATGSAVTATGGGDSAKTGDKLADKSGQGGATMAMAQPTTGSTLMSKSQETSAPDIKTPSASSSGTASPSASSGGGSSGGTNLMDNKEVPSVRPSDQVIAKMFDSRAFAA